jgi:hypothetical protein
LKWLLGRKGAGSRAAGSFLTLKMVKEATNYSILGRFGETGRDMITLKQEKE